MPNLEGIHTRRVFRSFEIRDRQVTQGRGARNADVAFIELSDMHRSSIAEVDEPSHGQHDSILGILRIAQRCRFSFPQRNQWPHK